MLTPTNSLGWGRDLVGTRTRWSRSPGGSTTFPPEHFAELTRCYASEGKTVVAYRMTDPGFPPWEDQNYPRLEVDWVYTALTNGASHA